MSLVEWGAERQQLQVPHGLEGLVARGVSMASVVVEADCERGVMRMPVILQRRYQTSPVTGKVLLAKRAANGGAGGCVTS